MTMKEKMIMMIMMPPRTMMMMDDMRMNMIVSNCVESLINPLGFRTLASSQGYNTTHTHNRNTVRSLYKINLYTSIVDSRGRECPGLQATLPKASKPSPLNAP